MKVYSVFDSQLKVWTKPIYLRNAAEATRSFEHSVGSPEIFAGVVEHVALFELGSFCDETAKFQLHVSPVHVINGIDFSKKTLQDGLKAVSAGH